MNDVCKGFDEDEGMVNDYQMVFEKAIHLVELKGLWMALLRVSMKMKM